MPRRGSSLLVPLIALLSGCGTLAPPTQTWVGPVTPKTSSAACGPSRGIARTSGDHLTFNPNEGTWILAGTAEPGGRATAERIEIGANKLPYETRFEGRWAPDTLTGIYTTPRCTFDVQFTRR